MNQIQDVATNHGKIFYEHGKLQNFDYIKKKRKILHIYKLV